MHLKVEKKEKRAKKMLEIKEARLLHLTEESNLLITQSGCEILARHFVVVTPKLWVARFGDSILSDTESIKEVETDLAVYTPSKFLYLGDGATFYIDGERDFEPSETFLAYFATPKFSELVAVHGKYGKNCLFRMYRPELISSSLQLTQMLLAAFEIEGISALREWLSAQIKLSERWAESDE